MQQHSAVSFSYIVMIAGLESGLRGEAHTALAQDSSVDPSTMLDPNPDEFLSAQVHVEVSE